MRIAAGASLFLILALCLLLAGGARPGASADAAGTLECRWTDRPVRIDGKATDEAWKSAPVIERFTVPVSGAPAKAGTRARLLWDRENLYFVAEMEDADLFADITEHDGRIWENDVFELFFKPAEDRPGYYEFEINAANTVLDMFMPRRGEGGYDRYRSDGDFHLETAVELRGTLNRRDDRDRGWTVEGRIPWRDFMRTGGRPQPGETWKLALCRYDYRQGAEPELTSSARLTQPSFHHYEDYTPLRFVGPEERKRPALTTSRVIGSPDPPPPYRSRRVYPKLKLDNPMMVVRQPVGDQYLTIVQEWGGGPSRVVRFRDHPDVATTEELLNLDRCAYDIVFHPDFQRNGYLYIGSKGPLSAESSARKMAVTRYTMSRTPPYALDPNSAVTIIDWPSDGHDGAAMVFGQDGTFYVTSGDGTTDSDTAVVGQDMSRLTAKLLRIDVDNPDPGRHYSVPKDNPFVGMEGARPETWAYGFRNPWRMTIDRETGHIWVGNNGQDLWEQAYLIEKGANYGWSVYEGSHPFYPNRKLGPTPVVKPTVEHPHSEARSLTGGIVYYGTRYPELRGAYVYGDYSTGKIWAIRHDGRRALWHREIADTTLQIAGFATDAHGEILIVDIRRPDGGFYTLEPSPPSATHLSFPRRLSESGLFRSVKGHVPDPALIPYDVNAPLWSDGAHKERYIALPGADARIDFTTWRGWNFPDGTVLVKSFALEGEPGNSRSRRWIETRFLTKQEGEWVGYSYEWNREQTDAVLVEAKGLDREYQVRIPRSKEHPDGIRKQSWRFPSRAECMTCHSRAANFVLGLNVLQMNRDHRWNGVRENQLRRLERLGVLRVDYAAEARELLREDGRKRGLTGDALEAHVNRHAAAGGQRGPAASSLLALPPEKYARLADPADAKQPLDLRARSYLHANCSGCHVEAGGGNSQIELELTTEPARQRIIDVKPVHDAYGLPDARLIAPGSPERSVLLHRISHRDRGHMPPLATSRVDEQAVSLLRQWVKQLAAPR
jgi:uncharacterized repeat protein (TIGR03806 family)